MANQEGDESGIDYSIVTRDKRLKRLRAEMWHLEDSTEGLTAQELAQKLGVSRRTVLRDLVTLRASGYPLSRTGSQWHFIEGQPLPTTLATDGANQAPERDRVLVVDRAIRMRRALKVEYWPFGPGNPVCFELAPLVLRYLEGSLFVVAREYPAGRMRALALERISNIEFSGNRYSQKLSKGIENYLEHHFRNHANGELVRVVVLFSPKLSWRVTERIWHPSQRVTVKDDGSALATVRVPGFTWVRAWVLGFGENAVVLEPPELVREIQKELERASERYQRLRNQVSQLDLFADQK